MNVMLAIVREDSVLDHVRCCACMTTALDYKAWPRVVLAGGPSNNGAHLPNKSRQKN